MDSLTESPEPSQARAGVSCSALFDLNSVLGDSPRLKEIKEHDIQTHYAPHVEEAPWLAIPMNAARAALKGYDLTEFESGSVAGIMSGYCRLLDDYGMTFTGKTKQEVEDAALDYCWSNSKINEPEFG